MYIYNKLTSIFTIMTKLILPKIQTSEKLFMRCRPLIIKKKTVLLPHQDLLCVLVGLDLTNIKTGLHKKRLCCHLLSTLSVLDRYAVCLTGQVQVFLFADTQYTQCAWSVWSVWIHLYDILAESTRIHGYKSRGYREMLNNGKKYPFKWLLWTKKIEIKNRAPLWHPPYPN